MFEDRSTLRNQEYRIGKIIQVDPVNYFVQMRDRFNGLFQVSLHVLDSIAVMPQVDEVWMVKRIGVDWVLDKRVDDGTEDIAITSLSPGDRRLYVPQHLYVSASGVQINSHQATFSGSVNVGNGLQFSNHGVQAATLWSGNSAPSNSLGSNGNFYFRTDTPSTSNQRLYVKVSNSWVGIL
jgi:hypothetical protein